MDRVEKIAQRRGLLNKIREKTNLTGKILETVNPEFREVMDKMREIDERIRDDADGLKETFRSAKSLNARRDYLNCASELSTFHEKCRYIANDLSKFEAGLDLKHYNFLLDQFDDSGKEKLFGYDPKAELKDRSKLASSNQFLWSSAGVLDWVADTAHNVFTEQGASRRALEKRFSVAFLDSLKKNTNTVVIETGRMLSVLLTSFKKLATALAKRSIKEYVIASKQFIEKFKTYHELFVQYYSKNIEPLKNQWQNIQKEIEEKARQGEEDKSKSLEDAAQAERLKSQPVVVNKNLPTLNENENNSVKNSPNAKELMKEREETLKRLNDEQGEEDKTHLSSNLLEEDEEEDQLSPANDNAKQANKLFMHYLTSFASKNDYSAMRETIMNYSNILKSSDRQKSLQLLSIAEGIFEDKKKDKNSLTSNDDLKFTVPLGEVDASLDSFPALAVISPQSIRITPETEHHIVNIVSSKIENYFHDGINHKSFDFRSKLINILKQAIYDGWIISSSLPSDLNNPKDRFLEIFCNLDLSPFARGIGNVKVRVHCRWSNNNKTLTIKTIQKSFAL